MRSPFQPRPPLDRQYPPPPAPGYYIGVGGADYYFVAAGRPCQQAHEGGACPTSGHDPDYALAREWYHRARAALPPTVLVSLAGSSTLEGRGRRVAGGIALLAEVVAEAASIDWPSSLDVEASREWLRNNP